MRTVGTIGLIVALLAAGCGWAPPSLDPSDALYVENRSGPDLVLKVGSAPEAALPCGATLKYRPGDPGRAGLPWSLEVRLADSGEGVLMDQVTQLPSWLVQLGDGEIGLATIAVLGPTMTCPPPS